MSISNEILDELIKDYKNPEDLIGEKGLLKQLTKRLVERAMEAELSNHLGYKKNKSSSSKKNNSRNGKSQKTVISDCGNLDIQTPRDRDSSFEPAIIPKHERRFSGFDDKILSMYSRGMTTRDIQDHLHEIYGTKVSPSLISEVTDAVIQDVREWQTRPIDQIYPIMYLDAIRVKVRDNGRIISKAIYVAMGVNLDGNKEILGLWISENEGAKFWAMIMTELQNRGLEDVFIACVDGLTGFKDAIESIFPRTEVQLCIVHMVRNSLKYVSWKDRKSVADALKKIYSSVNEQEANEQLVDFEKEWASKYPTITPLWRRHWDGVVPFLAYPEYIRKAIYTTNAIESLNHSLRKVLKVRGSFPTDESAIKMVYLGIKRAEKKWTRPIWKWKQALNQFAVMFEGRMPLN